MFLFHLKHILWHMPHGIFLHATPKSSNKYSLLYRASTSSTLSHNILCCNHTLVLFSDFFASAKSIHCNFYLLKTTAFPLLGKPPENSGTYYYAKNQRLARNNINNTQCASPKVLPPNQWCSTIHWRSGGTNDSSGASSDRQSSCTSHDFSPVTKSTPHKISLVKPDHLLKHIKSTWNSRSYATSCTSPCHRWWSTSHDLRPFARSCLINLLSITILLLLSPNRLGTDIYLNKPNDFCTSYQQ